MLASHHCFPSSLPLPAFLNCTENKPFENQSNLFTYQDMDVFTLSLYCFILDALFPSTCYVQNTAKHCKTRSSPPQALVCQFGLTFLATLHATVGIIHVSCQPWASPHLQGHKWLPDVWHPQTCTFVMATKGNLPGCSSVLKEPIVH